MNKLILKRSAVPGKIPQAGDLEYGELAINYSDGLLYFKDSTNVVKAVNNESVNLANSQKYHNQKSERVILNNTTASQVIDNLTTSSFESAEYTIQVTHPDFGKQISKLNVLFDQTIADSVEYGIVFTQAKLVDFTITFVGSTISVLATPQVSGCTVKYVRTLIF